MVEAEEQPGAGRGAGAVEAQAELDLLDPAFRRAFADRVPDRDGVWLAVGGTTSALIATRSLLFYLAIVRRNSPPVVNPIRLEEIRTVETLVGPARTGVRVLLRSGTQYLAWVPRGSAEQAMQAATVLNLLAADARAHRPLRAE